MAQSTSPSSETPGRLSADERRQQLIEVAIDLFSRRGFSGTTTKEIAAAAGVTEAIIFRHFATKQQLYTAILDYRVQSPGSEQWLAELQAYMARNDDEGLFRHLTKLIIRIHREDTKFERVMLYAALEGHELAAMYQQRLTVPFGDMLRSYVQRRQQEGALIQVDAQAVIVAMAGMPHYYAFHKHMCSYKDIALSDEEAGEAFTRILMHGIRSKANDE